MPANVPVTRTPYKYVDDKGDTYQVRLADYIATQVDGAAASIIGAVAATGTEPRIGSGGMLRRAIVRDLVAKHDRTVVVATPNAPLITVPTPAGAGTLTLNSPSGNQATYTYQGLFKTATRARR